MSVLESKEVLRPAPTGLKGWFIQKAMGFAPTAFGILRGIIPVAKFGSTVIVTRYDDVLATFADDQVFNTPYRENILILTDNQPFFLGMRDTPEYHRDLNAMRAVFTAADLPVMGDRCEAAAQAIVDAAGGEIEVVGDLVRKVTFDVYSDYLGIPQPETDNLDVWCTRLFAFQFTGSPDDTDMMADVNILAPALRDHIDKTIAARKASGEEKDDVLGRCLKLQTEGNAQYSDLFIRTNLLCMVVGGPPQVPMVTPQAMEQLLRRPDELSRAQSVAHQDDDAMLWRITREAMRFDPLAPALQRVAAEDGTVAVGTPRAKAVKKGDRALVSIASAMMDKRKVGSPKTFAPDRQDDEYVHFGHDLHECFGRFLNAATLHRILKPLLKRQNLRRAPGAAGDLTKNGIFADKLTVQFD